MSGAGGDLVVNLGINSGQFMQGTQQAAQTWQAALQQMIQSAQQFQQAAQQLGTTLSKQLGDGFAVVQDSAEQTKGALGDGPTGFGAVLANLGSGFASAGGEVLGFGGKILAAINPLQLFHTHVMRLVEVMGLWRLFEQGTRLVSEFTSSIAQLPVTMERTEQSWKYVFGMNDASVQAMPGGPVGSAGYNAQQRAAMGISQKLAAWSAQYSYNVPYTRQDMLTAINMMGMTGLNSAGIEKYMPLLADLASTAGTNMFGQPVDLTQAAFATMDANMGLTRSLKTQLKINPEDLVQFGFQTGNPATLWPALQAYAQSKHYTGAAQDIARNTWFGASSSFQDRWQNLALDVGGYPAFGPDAGTLRQGSPFDVARQGLLSLNDFWDKHQSQINDFANFLSKTLGQGLKDAGSAMLSFGQGISDSGITGSVGAAFMNFAQWLKDPNVQAGIQNFAKGFGGDIGSGLQNLGGDINDVTNAFDRLKNDFGNQNLQTATGALEAFVKTAAGLFNSLAKVTSDSVVVIGDQFKALAALKAGDWQGFLAAQKQAGIDQGQMHIDVVDATGSKVDLTTDKHVLAGPHAKGWSQHAIAKPLPGHGSTVDHRARGSSDARPSGHPVNPDTEIAAYSGLFNVGLGMLSPGLGAAANFFNPVEWTYNMMKGIFGGQGSGGKGSTGGGPLSQFSDLGTALGGLHTTVKPLNDQMATLQGNVQMLNTQVGNLNTTLANLNRGGGGSSGSSGGNGRRSNTPGSYAVPGGTGSPF